MLENKFPTAGPNMVTMTITTSATKLKINAYSIKPWPSSRGIYNIVATPRVLKSGLKILDEVRENVTNRRAKQSQNDDNNNGHQNQDQRVFDQALAFFTGHVQRNEFSWNDIWADDW